MSDRKNVSEQAMTLLCVGGTTQIGILQPFSSFLLLTFLSPSSPPPFPHGSAAGERHGRGGRSWFAFIGQSMWHKSWVRFCWEDKIWLAGGSMFDDAFCASTPGPFCRRTPVPCFV
jgi:hypothetical protein